MARNPLDVDLDVLSGIEDGMEVFDNLEAEVLAWGGVGFDASADCCLVVDKYPDGLSGGVVLCPTSSIGGGL